VAVAAFVMTVFRLPTAELSGRINLWHGLVFVVTFLGSLVQGALVIAWQILTPGLPGTAVVRVPLRSDDDLIMTHVAVTCSLIPGSVVVEADRERRILYLHVIGVENADDIEKQRRIAQRWEERAVRAVGSRADLELVRSDAPPYVSRMATGGAS
jgi:multicomponent Na+:H+ antiporter subunit E